MAAHRLDDLARRLAPGRSRRSLFTHAALIIAALAREPGPTSAQRSRCRRPGAPCSRQSPCCKGTRCVKRRCGCTGGKKRCGTTCITRDTCCRQTEIACQGECIPNTRCCTDEDCDGQCQTCSNLTCVPKSPGTSCGFRGVKVCNASGACVDRPCTAHSSCPPLDEATIHEEYCYVARCEGGICKETPLDDSSYLPERFQRAGDCGRYWCAPGIPNGRGISTDRTTWDPPESTDCTTYQCSHPGVTETIWQAAGTACDGGNGTCDGAGNCVPR